MTKTYRQEEILKLIRAQPVRTQEELSAALEKTGIRVTQVTLSRDIHELGLVKGPKGYREAGPSALAEPEPRGSALRRAIEEYVREVKVAQNLVIIKTVRGTAAPVADALDRGGWPEIIGTIAGEDTVFVATPDARRAQQARDKLMALLH